MVGDMAGRMEEKVGLIGEVAEVVRQASQMERDSARTVGLRTTEREKEKEKDYTDLMATTMERL